MLKKNKYEKLLKLYKNEVAKKEQLGTKHEDLKMKKKHYEELKAQVDAKRAKGTQQNEALTEKDRIIDTLKEYTQRLFRTYDTKCKEGIKKAAEET